MMSAKPRRQQGRTTSRKPERKTGKLSRLQEMPVEIICEILSLVEPGDLLKLSRIKELRAFLTSKETGRRIWTISMMADGVPDPPTGFNELQWTYLLFDKQCNVCGHRAGKLDAHLRVRLCSYCRKANVLSGDILLQTRDFSTDDIRQGILLSLAPWTNMSVDKIGVRESSRKRQFLGTEFMRVTEQFLLLAYGSEERNAFVLERKRILTEICKSADSVVKWEQKKNTEKNVNRDKVVEERKARILKELKVLKYTDTDFDGLGDYEQPFARNWKAKINVAKHPTDRQIKNMIPVLKQCIEDRREFDRRCLLEKRASVVNTILGDYRTGVFSANGRRTLDYQSLLQYANQVDISGWNLPVTEVQRRDWHLSLLDLEARFTHERERQFAEMIQSIRQSIQLPMPLSEPHHMHFSTNILPMVNQDLQRSNVRFLQHASSLFLCSENYMRKVGIVNHECYATFYEIQYMEEKRTTSRDAEVWTKNWVSHPAIISVLVDRLLFALGLHPATTMITVDGWGSSFICNRCDPLLQKSLTWRELVIHFIEETKWYHRASSSLMELQHRCGHELEDLFDGITLIDDHNFSVLSPQCVSWVSSWIPPPTAIVSNFEENYVRPCAYCERLDIKVYKEPVELRIHYRRKGRLPPPKRKNLNDSSEDEDEDAFKFAQPIKKKTRRDTEKVLEDTVPEQLESGQSAGTEEEGLVPEALEACDEEPAAPIAQTKFSRYEGLVTGPDSKASWKSVKKKEIKVTKAHLGKLARMLELPVDVFCEIASHLSVLDILNLSRSSRLIRDLLMSKSSRTIWTASIIGMDLPPCPEDLNEPQYANLYFEKFCHGCGYHRVEKVQFNLRVRLCKGCTSLNIVRGSAIAKEEFGIQAAKQNEIYTLVPWNHMTEWDISRPVNSRMSQRHFLRSEFIYVVKQYFSIEPESEARNNFVRERHRILKNKCTHNQEMDKWWSRQYKEKRIIVQKSVESRRAIIFERLIDLGYTNHDLDSIDDPYSDSKDRYCSTWKSLLSQPRELTERGWKLMKPKLEECIKRRREARIEKEQEDRQMAREKELATYFIAFSTASLKQGRNTLLGFADLCQYPQIRKLLEEDDWNLEITNERWQVFKTLLPGLIDHHRRRIELDCTRLVLHGRSRQVNTSLVGNVSSTNEDTSPTTVDTDILYRADVFFHSVSPAQQAWEQWESSIVSFSDIIQMLQRYVPTRLDYKWNSDETYYTNLIGDVAAKLLSSLGFEEDATMAELDALGQCFICERCDPLLQKSMSWQELIKHYIGELVWYKHAEDRRGRKIDAIKLAAIDESHLTRTLHQFNKVRLISDHAPSDPQILATRVEGALRQQQVNSRTGSPTRCQLCENLGTHVLIMPSCLPIHLRKKHGLEDVDIL